MRSKQIQFNKAREALSKASLSDKEKQTMLSEIEGVAETSKTEASIDQPLKIELNVVPL